MNYGKRGITHKKNLLNSSSTKILGKLGVTAIKLSFILAITILVAGSCLAFGVAQGIIASAPEITSVDVSPEGYATKLYDCKSKEIQTLSTSGSNRISVDIDNVPLLLQHAFIAIEDERFYEHNGIDFKGILRAGANVISSGRLSQGASTLTQQLIKNNVFNAFNETTIEKVKRKIQEQYLAVKLETIMSKDEILENYLNTINLGSGYYGIQSAANGYFGKNVNELSLSECAVIASITQSPSNLNPAKYPEENRKRQLRVLTNMKDQGYIDEAAYQEAVDDDVYERIQNNTLQTTGPTTYSYFVDTTIEKVIEDLQTQKGYTEAQATNLIYKGGLSIYTTQDTMMQSIADSVINNPSYYPENVEYSINYNISIKNADGTVASYSHYALLDYFTKIRGNSRFTLTFSSKDKAQQYVDEYKQYLLKDGATVIKESITYTPQPQMSFTLIDQHTGEVKVIVGGRGDKQGNRTLNRATSSTRSPGSSLKPLAVFGPAMDLGTIGLATAIDDAPYFYSGEDARLVKNYTEGEYRGLISVREALKISQNVPAVKVLTQITPQVGFNYLLKFGISSLVAPKDAVNGYHDVVQSMALGGLTHGVYNIDICSAYSAIANGGVRISPIYYTKVVDKNGEIILDNSTKETTTVIKESTAWLLTDGLKTVVEEGTAKLAKLSNQPAAGKTGTTQFDSDKWFCGFTPYYTAAIWLGYDDNSKKLPASIKHVQMWHDIMEEIHQKLKLPESEFVMPDDIVEVEVCSQSGKLAVPGLCDKDPRGSQLVTDYFALENVPTEYCDIHVKVSVCADSGMIASTACTKKQTKILVKKSSLIIPPEALEVETDEAGEPVEELPDYESIKTWDQDYSITQEELSTVCTTHKGSSTYNNRGTTTDATTTAGTTRATTSAATSGTTRATTAAPATSTPRTTKPATSN